MNSYQIKKIIGELKIGDNILYRNEIDDEYLCGTITDIEDCLSPGSMINEMFDFKCKDCRRLLYINDEYFGCPMRDDVFLIHPLKNFTFDEREFEI